MTKNSTKDSSVLLARGSINAKGEWLSKMVQSSLLHKEGESYKTVEYCMNFISESYKKPNTYIEFAASGSELRFIVVDEYNICRHIGLYPMYLFFDSPKIIDKEEYDKIKNKFVNNIRFGYSIELGCHTCALYLVSDRWGGEINEI